MKSFQLGDSWDLHGHDIGDEWHDCERYFFHALSFVLQPRDTCYVGSVGFPELSYSGYQPHAYSWDEFPPLKDILEAVHKAFPGSNFNSLLLNRYKGGNDFVGWHADDEKLYGSTPEITSVSFGCDREFLLKKKPSKMSQGITKAPLLSLSL
ncbi:oxidoreductase, 2OG-Fe(II) oxygenase family protein [Actinidia rufa]|uniref:Oxidoreductase, 2OG-Fe(II) oxygenase family protein n=1 Tax=Actinidia rufa TaxID=165716 RepID=A0A7J0EZN2_9ERIC|nr:oxidoreductase, 2OG-Fe(II) oxygenase family protein [Actinidia rufa]